MPQKRRGRKSPWQVQLRDVSGKLMTKSFVCREDALEYELAFTRNRQRQRASMEPIVLPTTFAAFKARWMPARKPEVTESTWSGEEQKLADIWIPKIGEKLLSDITRKDIEPVLRDLVMKDGLSPATRNRHRALLSTMFESAKTDGRCVMNPVTDIPILKETKTRSMGYWSDPAFMEKYIAGAYAEGPMWGSLKTVLAFTGMRIGEAIALQERDLDFERKLVLIQRIRETKTGLFKERTKGGGDGSVEPVPMWPRVEMALKELMASRSRMVPGWLFLQDGEPVTYWKVETFHNRLIDRLGLPRITLHGLRHTCSTLFQRAGMSREDAQLLLRHANLETTEVYSHPDMDYLIEKARGKGFGQHCPPTVSQERQA